MSITQADLAAVTQLSAPTVGRIVAMWRGRRKSPLTDLDRLVVLAVDELINLGLNSVVATKLLQEFAGELVYAAAKPENRAWILFVPHDVRDFRVAASSGRHFITLVERHPLAIVLPLHVAVQAAVQRLAMLKAGKESA